MVWVFLLVYHALLASVLTSNPFALCDAGKCEDKVTTTVQPDVLLLLFTAFVCSGEQSWTPADLCSNGDRLVASET